MRAANCSGIVHAYRYFTDAGWQGSDWRVATLALVVLAITSTAFVFPQTRRRGALFFNVGFVAVAIAFLAYFLFATDTAIFAVDSAECTRLE